MIKEVEESEKDAYNQVAPHPTQSWQWGDFLKKNGKKIVRFGKYDYETLAQSYLIQFKKVPLFPYTIGYLQNCCVPDKEVIDYLKQLGRHYKAIFIKIEPNATTHTWNNQKGKLSPQPFRHQDLDLAQLGLAPAKKAIFDQYSFEIDITKPEDDLLQNMHPKTRYNIRIAQKHDVKIEEQSNEDGLKAFLHLTRETIKRQNFYQHEAEYFKNMWKALKDTDNMHILTAKYKDQVISTWILFTWNNILYYPYGASLSKFKNVMASNLLCWEAIKFGKEKGCTKFDLWGSLGPDADSKHSWFGFHRFKLGYGGDLIQRIGSWDLVLNRPVYELFYLAEKARWLKLKMLRRKTSQE